VHAALLAASLFELPLGPAGHWKPTGGEEPVRHIVCLIAALLGIAMAAGPGYYLWHYTDGVVAMERNFYGSLRVKANNPGTDFESRVLVHGTVALGSCSNENPTSTKTFWRWTPSQATPSRPTFLRSRPCAFISAT
jgi:hypothetical protein